MQHFKKQFKNAFTGKDNETLDIGRIIWAVGALVFFGLSVYAAVHLHVFDAIAYGTAFGAIMAGGGIGIGMKGRTEPDPEPDTQVNVQVQNNEDKK